MDNKTLWENGVILSFDLDTNKLKEYYTGNTFNKAYRDIQRYLISEGFSHLKDSDYINENIQDFNAHKIIMEFSEENKWFPFCINKLNISPNIEKIDISDEIRKLQDKEWEEEIISTNIVHKAEEELEF